MKNAITHVKKPPEITMSVDSVAYFGQNQIRRNVAKSISLYVGSTLNDRVIDVPPGGVVEVNLSLNPEGDVFEGERKSDVFFTDTTPGSATIALYLVTSAPLIVQVSDSIELNVKKYLFLDHPVQKLILENNGCVNARVNLAYLT